MHRPRWEDTGEEIPLPILAIKLAHRFIANPIGFTTWFHAQGGNTTKYSYDWGYEDGLMKNRIKRSVKKSVGKVKGVRFTGKKKVGAEEPLPFTSFTLFEVSEMRLT